MGKTNKVSNISNVYTGFCEHFRDPIDIGGYTLLASEHTWRGDIYAEPLPDIAVYLSTLWDDIFVTAERHGECPYFDEAPPVGTPYPTVLVDWTDGGAIPADLLDWLVKGVIQNLESGNLVEVGCTGGHGRTGTLIACVLGRVEQLDARSAILALRKRYCKKAVETLAQLYLVAHYLGSPFGDVEDLVPPKGVLTYDPKTHIWSTQ